VTWSTEDPNFGLSCLYLESCHPYFRNGARMYFASYTESFQTFHVLWSFYEEDPSAYISKRIKKRIFLNGCPHLWGWNIDIQAVCTLSGDEYGNRKTHGCFRATPFPVASNVQQPTKKKQKSDIFCCTSVRVFITGLRVCYFKRWI
jgi:hypothetical protein